MTPLDVTWHRCLRVLWLILWRGLLGATLISLVVGLVFSFACLRLGVPREVVVRMATACGGIIGIVWNVAVIGMALRKRYRGFRIVLVAA